MVTICTTFFNIKGLCILPTECICGFRVIFRIISDYFPNDMNKMIIVLEIRCAFFQLETELLNSIYMNLSHFL
jgi:hypothetical protein